MTYTIPERAIFLGYNESLVALRGSALIAWMGARYFYPPAVLDPDETYLCGPVFDRCIHQFFAEYDPKTHG